MNAQPALHPTDQTLSSYGLGKLDDAAAELVNAHLEGCPVCRSRVAAASSDSFLGRLRDANVHPASPAPVGSLLAGLSMLDGGAARAVPPEASTMPPGLADHHDYEIIRELGRGGMGVVYLAQNALMGRMEVLKVVSGHLINRPGVLDRFLREIRSAAKLQHSNIVTAYAAFRLRESFVLAMEYVDGIDLYRVVKAKGPLPVANACYYIHQAAMGLQHAHENGMVHRDIKPANLILARAGTKGNTATVKVLDFGLAKLTSEDQRGAGLTREGQMLGTPDYIAPEQIRDAQSADIRADIYSLGCTLYYLLSGGPPFSGDSLWDVYQAHFSMDAGPLNLLRPEVPVELAALVAKMMAKEPHRRFQEPKVVAQALKPFFESGDAASLRSKPIDMVRRGGMALRVPDSGYPGIAEAPSAKTAVIEPRKEVRRGRHRVGSPALAIAASALALLASLTTAVWTWMGKGRDQAGANRAARTVETGPIPNPALAPGPKVTRPEHQPAGDDPEHLVRDALAAVRGGSLNQARFLLNQYLSHPQPRKQLDAARVLLREIDLATSSIEAEALARRLSDREIQAYLANGGQPLVDTSVQTPDLRLVYARTLLQAFRQESNRRQIAPNDGVALAQGTQQGPLRVAAAVPKAASEEDADADRPPASLLGSDDEIAPTPGKVADRKDATTIEMIIDSPQSFEDRTITLEGLYKIATLLTRMKGSDGNPIGWSLAVGGADDRLICKEDGKVVGRDRYLILDRDLGPILFKAYDDLKFRPAARPTYKCTLTVTVRPMVVNNARVPVITIVGLEILGICDFLQIAQRQYEKAFRTVRLTREKAWVDYGDGASWVQWLGGEERFVKPIRKRLRDLQRRAIAEQGHAVVGSILQAELARTVNMAIVNQQQQARFAAAVIGVR